MRLLKMHKMISLFFKGELVMEEKVLIFGKNT